MTSPTRRPCVAIVGDDRGAAQIIARGVPGYDTRRGIPTPERCELVHRIGAAPAIGAPAGVPVLVTSEKPAAGAVRWDPGVDLRRFNPGRARGHDPLPGAIAVLHAGAGADLVAEAVLAARARDDRVRLVGSAADDPDTRAIAYARADIVVAVDADDRSVLEAQASGAAVVFAGSGDLVRDGHTGRRCSAEPAALATAILELAFDAAERARLGRAARYSTRAYSCEVAMARLAGLYDGALLATAEPAERAVAA